MVSTLADPNLKTGETFLLPNGVGAMVPTRFGLPTGVVANLESTISIPASRGGTVVVAPRIRNATQARVLPAGNRA